MAGQSSSLAPKSPAWWKPALFFLVLFIGLWYVKWQPYYGKAFTAAQTHSIGNSILANAQDNPRRSITPVSIFSPSGKPPCSACCWAR